MPVNYNLSASTSRPWTFIKLIFKWDGSVWKAIWMQYAVWLGFYFILSGYYRWIMDIDQKKTFAQIVDYTDRRLKYFPLSWMLGFFVAAVMARWKYLYNIIGWMDNTALIVAQYVRGTSERARMYRRQIVRHCMVTQALVFRDLSVRCRKRFPTLDTLVAAGILTQHEFDVFEEIQYRYARYWVPFQWAWAVSYNAWKEGLIEGAYYQQIVSDTIREFRTGLAWLCNYDWCPLPMVYPTIVCLSVHIYFLVAIVARQYVQESENFHIDLVFPFMTSFQFIFYMGWLKVGEAMLNPWGEDDDDFETNLLIDRNLTMSLKIVDEGYGKTPYLAKDTFWDHEWQPMYPEDFDFSTQKDPRLSMADLRLPSSVSEIRMVPLQQRRGMKFEFNHMLLYLNSNPIKVMKAPTGIFQLGTERESNPNEKSSASLNEQGGLPRLGSIILPGVTLVEENNRKISVDPGNHILSINEVS
ncbi:unnamed protein product, partial [Mesorhabditis belari]|uniref:Bestrophin homolog n=1 Tax=Mesorhabditis belari TaxID=2138241 RepID=A0AAF3EBH5_9BILA